MIGNALPNGDEYCPLCGADVEWYRENARTATGRRWRKDAVYHSARCKQRAWRFRKQMTERDIPRWLREGSPHAVRWVQVLGWASDDPRWWPLYRAAFRPPLDAEPAAAIDEARAPRLGCHPDNPA